MIDRRNFLRALCLAPFAAPAIEAIIKNGAPRLAQIEEIDVIDDDGKTIQSLPVCDVGKLCFTNVSLITPDDVRRMTRIEEGIFQTIAKRSPAGREAIYW